MIPSINLGTDSLGLGQMFSGTVSGITSAAGTEECGSKPTCIAITKTCKDKNKYYNECRMKALEVKDNASLRSTPATSGASPNQTTLIIVAVVLLVALVLILKNK